MQKCYIHLLALPYSFCEVLNLCAINTQLSVGALSNLIFNHTTEAKVLEFSLYQASTGPSRLISLGPMPERDSCTALPASLDLRAV